ncbi:hypothetical protein BDV11DRAFT_37284 [Aspergillus similis]
MRMRTNHVCRYGHITWSFLVGFGLRRQWKPSTCHQAPTTDPGCQQPIVCCYSGCDGRNISLFDAKVNYYSRARSSLSVMGSRGLDRKFSRSQGDQSIPGPHRLVLPAPVHTSIPASVLPASINLWSTLTRAHVLPHNRVLLWGPLLRMHLVSGSCAQP